MAKPKVVRLRKRRRRIRKSESDIAYYNAEIDVAFTSVASHRVYIDSIQLALRERPPRHLRDQLLKVGASSDKLRPSKNWQRPHRLIIHRPNPRALEIISSALPAHVINRVDIALDFVTTSMDDAAILRDFLAFHVTMPWHGRQSILVDRGTVYFRRAWRRRNIVCYAEPNSRHCGDPCTHLELRFYGVEACRARGAETAEQMARIDLLAIASRECRLTFVNHRIVNARIDAMVDRRMKRPFPFPSTRERHRNRIETTIRRACQTESETPESLLDIPAQAWIDSWPTLVRRAVTHFVLIKRAEWAALRGARQLPYTGVADEQTKQKIG